MVSSRCKQLVKNELQNIGIYPTEIDLGEVTIDHDPSTDELRLIGRVLKECGLELIMDKKAVVIEKIKNCIIEIVHHSDEAMKVNLSSLLSSKLGYNYTYLSNLFSEVTGSTIEQFHIIHRIERAKEYILYDELSLTEIAEKLHFSSVGHLSNQFKKVTGLTPSFFKGLKLRKRSMLEDL